MLTPLSTTYIMPKLTFFLNDREPRKSLPVDLGLIPVSLKSYPVLFSSVSIPLLFVVQIPEPTPVGRPPRILLYPQSIQLIGKILHVVRTGFPSESGPSPDEESPFEHAYAADVSLVQVAEGVQEVAAPRRAKESAWQQPRGVRKPGSLSL